MDPSIISRDLIREKARRAFATGKGRDDHNMNWFVPAVKDWQAEWDRCARAAAQVEEALA